MTTEAEIRSWISGYARDWDQACQALMWQTASRFGSVVSTPGSAIEAYEIERRAGRISGGDAPPGTFVYYDIGSYGHVGMMLDGGRVFMTGKPSRTAEQWGAPAGRNVGWNSIGGYAAASGATYLGWSPLNGGNSVPFDSTGESGGSSGGSDWAWNPPDAETQARIQRALTARGRYAGPADGVWGPNTVMGIQTTCQNVGYDGPIDGEPGPNTARHVQIYAQRFGDYGGPIDQILGPNSWAGFALGLERP